MPPMGHQQVLFLDGGLGTSLEDKYHVQFDESTPLWSSHPLVSGQTDTLLACQSDFGRVPVDILLTATYQVSIEGFARTLLSTNHEGHPDGAQRGIPRQDIPPYLQDAVSIAEKAKSPDARVALSLGPYGACMMPSQEYSGKYDAAHSSVEQLQEWHADRLGLFSHISNIQQRVNFLAFETVPRLDEIVAIRRLFGADPTTSPLGGQIPYWISCVFPGDAYTLPDESTIDRLIDDVCSLQHSSVRPWGVGVNCTKLEKIEAVVEQYEVALDRLTSLGKLGNWRPNLLLYPDGTNGEVYNTATKEWERPSSEQAPEVDVTQQTRWDMAFAAIVHRIQSRECWPTIVVGGCCKSSHVDIANVRRAILRSTQARPKSE